MLLEVFDFPIRHCHTCHGPDGGSVRGGSKVYCSMGLEEGGREEEREEERKRKREERADQPASDSAGYSVIAIVRVTVAAICREPWVTAI